MPQVAAAAAIVGAGIAIYGDIKTASDQAAADNTRATIAQQQSAELQGREQENEIIRNDQAMRQKLQFGASYAASGAAGVGIGSQLQIQNQTDIQNMISNRETQFQEQMLQEQAGIDTTLAGQATAAGTLKAVGAGLGAASTLAGMGTSGGSNPGYGPPSQSIGAYPSLGVNTSMGLGSMSTGG